MKINKVLLIIIKNNIKVIIFNDIFYINFIF